MKRHQSFDTRLSESMNSPFIGIDHCELSNIRKKINLEALVKKFHTFRKDKFKAPYYTETYFALKYISENSTFNGFSQKNNVIISRCISIKDSKTYLNIRLLRAILGTSGLHKQKYKTKEAARSIAYRYKLNFDSYGAHTIIIVDRKMFEKTSKDTKYKEILSEEEAKTWNFIEIKSDPEKLKKFINFWKNEKGRAMAFSLLNCQEIDSLDIGARNEYIHQELKKSFFTSVFPFSVIDILKSNPLISGGWSFTKNGLLFERSDSAFMFKMLFDEYPGDVDDFLKTYINGEDYEEYKEQIFKYNIVHTFRG